MASVAGVGSGEEVGIGGFREAMDRRRLIRGSIGGGSMALWFQKKFKGKKERTNTNIVLVVG